VNSQSSLYRRSLNAFSHHDRPNMAVKGTRRPDAVLKVGLCIRFGDFVARPFAARPLPLR
jgi:hypothetical protein